MNINTSIQEISQLMNKVVDISDKTSTSTGKLNSSLTSIHKIMNETNESMKDQVMIADRLADLVDKFRL